MGIKYEANRARREWKVDCVIDQAIEDQLGDQSKNNMIGGMIHACANAERQGKPWNVG